MKRLLEDVRGLLSKTIKSFILNTKPSKTVVEIIPISWSGFGKQINTLREVTSMPYIKGIKSLCPHFYDMEIRNMNIDQVWKENLEMPQGEW